MNRNNSCFAYTRVSTVKQGEGVSLEAQKEAIQAFADKNGLTITKWHEERETAAKSGRPIFLAMMKELQAGHAGGVIIHKIDRSARNIADWAKIGELSDSGVDVHFAAESLDFRSRGGRLTADIQAVIAADYIRNLREETLKGIRGRLKQGLYPFKAPLGYLDNGGGKVKTIDPIAGPLVKELFEAYASGEHSLMSLVAFADSIGLRNASEKPISKKCIEVLLSNPFYIGIIKMRATQARYQGSHQALIPNSLFKCVQDVRAGKAVKKVTKHQHTFRRLFTCTRCSRPYIGERQKGYVYYRCHTPQCTKGTIREDVIAQKIASELRVLSPVGLSANLLKSYCSEQRLVEQASTQNAGLFAAQLAQTEKRKTKLLDALIDGIIDQSAYEERNAALLLEAAEIAEKRSKANEINDVNLTLGNLLELVKNPYFTYSLADAGEKRQIIELLYSNREIDDKNLVFKPRNWVLESQNCVGVSFGAPNAHTNRNLSDIDNAVSEDIITQEQQTFYNKVMEIWTCPEVQVMWSIHKKYHPSKKQKKR